ncbi:mannosyl-glycoprotein endo-beta-N-acetylglucosamidase [Lentilactobacillus parakefiri DSM 10551]|nr:glucosaminidase domain-containing protein [Lentilactobacillus parakefiri]KRL61186.1 mannosyl-glycoprotein endo-beta-N-acetylglucosamidase [Lentilactobacillus parakefiri DSM 10551]
MTLRKQGWRFTVILLLTFAVLAAGVSLRGQLSHRPQRRSVPTLVQKKTDHFSTEQKRTFISRVGAPAVKLYLKNRQVLPSVVIAQAILESQFGTSELSTQANNLFGIKGRYHGQSVQFYTREVENGKSIKVLAEFRKYPNLAASIADHNQLVSDKFIKAKNILSYRKSTHLLQENGYATDPHYAAKLNRLIVKYQLSRYDLKAINERV